MQTRTREEVPDVFGDQGRLRNRFHTRSGARLLNSFTRPIWRVLPPKGFGVITTIGRRTGQPRECCIRVVVQGTKAFVVSIVGEPVDWLRNARETPTVQLRTRGLATSALARDLRDDEAAKARVAFCETPYACDYLEWFLHRRGLPRRSKIVQLHERWFDQGTPLVLDLTG